MKSRSHRLPVDPRHEWVEEEESWTVDCVCGVNFDDGEEMVNCDECGVWVHTRCSRYVKTEKSFVCDKCKKSKNNHPHHHATSTDNDYYNNSFRNDSEETEVAQLLVELPTKTLRMDNHCPPPLPSSYKPSPFPPPRRPFRLWTDIPMQDRVHVQGIPGGDPTLFSGLSSVFGPHLWKCTGYVPKKFNFRYREFPSWDEEEEEEDVEKDVNANIDDGGEPRIIADNGMADLFSLSREHLLPVPKVESVGLDGQAEDGEADKLVMSPKQITMLEGHINLDVSTPENEPKKDRSLLQAPVIHFSKRKKDDVTNPKDKSGKKKARIMEKDGDFKKKCLHTPGTASTNASDAKQSQISEERGPKNIQADPQSGNSGNSSHSPPGLQLSHEFGIVDYVVDAHKSNLGSSESGSAKLSFDAPRHSSSSIPMPKDANGGQQLTVKLEGSSKTMGSAASLSGNNDSGGVPVKQEVSIRTAVSPNEFGGELTTKVVMDLQMSSPHPADLATAQPKTEVNENAPDSSLNTVSSCSEVHAKVKSELADTHRNIQPPPLYDANLGASGTLVKSKVVSADCSSENVVVSDVTITDSEVSKRKMEDVVKRSDDVDIRKDRVDRVDGESPLNSCPSNHDYAGLDSSFESKKILEGFSSNSGVELSKPGLTVVSPRVNASEGKTIASVGNLSPASSTFAMPKSFASENCISASNQNHNTDSKQKGIPESNLAGNQGNGGATIEVVKDKGGHERTRKLVKELPKSALGSVSKSSQLKKFSHPSVSKRTSPDIKDSMLHSSAQPSPLHHIASNTGSELTNVVHIENASDTEKMSSMLQTETASSMQKKVPGSVSSQKVEKISPSMAQSLSKVNTTLTHAATSSNSPATLSDEELALLLHQELNSSPRVPRVPRMRHAGSLPQLTSPTATSTLMKRTSSTGGKDHVLTSRRKTKDLAKDGSHGSREMDDEAKKMERVSSSLDHGRQDSAFASDPVGKKEAERESANGVYSTKKSNAPSGATAAGDLSSPAEGNEHNLLSTRHSSRTPIDDEKGVVGHHTHRTLPGLLAEIMSKGQRMTYEELCNAVLPHWPNLRKHNGERYAYSSHSQAVLDCLRNRNEWARLVDRGPKTSGGRRKRKLGADHADVDSEDNDDSREQTAKDTRSKTVESHHEEFPKGKRKARKRRRLALQGRGIKDVRRRRRTDELSDDEVGSLSESSEETMCSEDEMQGCRMSASGNEVPTGSDGTGNT
ncbi:uncharacterized protein [Coffea arabica]|uniref:Uncharacterized protein LOC113703565 n=1 Tax=Coffea arabica TaxID=13443 RepID=A0A6P6TS11_COFAR|nr:uncharacterized protein LOC113703565 [Coffea arabica]XP_027080767.1 uncharacterized protein LOC113703565 [Coffea arabica]